MGQSGGRVARAIRRARDTDERIEEMVTGMAARQQLEGRRHLGDPNREILKDIDKSPGEYPQWFARRVHARRDRSPELASADGTE
jgi:hypothetical protein